MVGKFLAIEAVRETFLDLRQDGSAPVVPFADQALIHVLLAVLEIGALQRVFHNVEEERIVEDFEEFVIAIADRPLRVRLVAPEQLTRNRGGTLSQHRQEIHGMEGGGGIGWRSSGREERPRSMQAQSGLLQWWALPNATGAREPGRTAGTPSEP